eukprot:CAMPEP_0204605814 /NCGR_PEP_ID=MMETSP0661-20131031/58711_1 /ASSEMBLY_ACC=CAM_ASM_000606 /TAXON_ID=109239 /ORGANISM="Alexandrium margalefi, Strain AMGDE01CS-322" /LENGTH=222 /DNA_ID=CAMNT_0051617083 /DNA_START=150 /DNA_END=817 /DNA_ORIENTATION=-
MFAQRNGHLGHRLQGLSESHRVTLITLGGLHAHEFLMAARRQHRHDGRLPCGEGVKDLLLDLLVVLSRLASLDEAGQVQVVLRLAALEQQAHGAVTLVGVQELVLRPLYERDVEVVRRGAQVLKLLAGEDVNGHDVRLGVAVLPSLRGRDLCDLAGVPLDHHVRPLLDLPSLHRVGHGRACVGGLEGMLVIVAMALFAKAPVGCHAAEQNWNQSSWGQSGLS